MSPDPVPTRRLRRRGHAGARDARFEARVVAALRRLAPGDVATYGEIAADAGFPGAARAVGNVLARSEGLPWWRVVRADGGLVRGHEAEQARRLESEGVRVVGGRVARRDGRP